MQTIGISLAARAAVSFLLTWRVGLAQAVPPLAVPEDHVGAADVDQHRAGDLAGEGPRRLPVHVLRAQADRRAFQDLVDPARGRRTGGQTATCTSVAGPRPVLTPSARATAASVVVGFIFQLPAISRVRMRPVLLHRRRSSCPSPRPAAGARPSAGRTGRASSACGPSERAFSGQEWTSTWTPSQPAATAARAIAGIRSGRPVAWLGSTMIGRWLSPLTLGTIDRSSVFRVESSNVRMPALAEDHLGGCPRPGCTRPTSAGP